LDGALTRLIHYEGVEETFNVSPWSYAFDTSVTKVSLDNSRFYSWWSTQMLLTNRPLKENLALFWHNHFAVSGSKIEDGSMMLGYLNVLRENANGNFRKMLSNVAHDPAMIKWLDSDTNIKGKPNENFGREVMELFTLGIGHYTEKDVQEAARAFTGWSVKYAVNFPRKTPYYNQVRMNLEADRPMYCFCDCPALHDDGFKTILGKRGTFNAEQTFDILVDHPAHAPFLMKKMFEWFVYPNPEPAALEKLCKVYRDGNYEIKPVIMYLATSDEFWSDKAQRAVVKSPVAYTIGLGRQLGLGPALAKGANLNCAATEPVGGSLLGMGYFLANVMQKQGLQLLFPPDVSGWRWGTHWITSAAMMERVRIGDYLFNQRRGLVVPNLWKNINDAYSPKTTADIVNAMVAWFDAPLSDDDKKVLVDAADKAGGVKAFAKAGTAGPVMDSVFRLIASTPEYQMC
jgi:uncharacterized protein (DUF1800 family)